MLMVLRDVKLRRYEIRERDIARSLKAHEESDIAHRSASLQSEGGNILP